jgi:hypothetical protein
MSIKKKKTNPKPIRTIKTTQQYKKQLVNCDKHNKPQHTHLTTDFSTTLTSSMMLVGVNDSATNHRSSSRKRFTKATNNSWLSKREREGERKASRG